MRLTLALGLLVVAAPAAANGLSTHVWISLEARRHLPPGPLAELLAEPALADILVSGTIFPDGGYAVGDDYGERAHWEPFQMAYLAWIRAQYSPPWSAEARRHIAFLLGMSSHGMADQVFDGLYMERARQEDAASDWSLSMDEATDVFFVSKLGKQPVPMRWLPVETIRAVMREAHGHELSADTVNRGQNLAGLAVALVGVLGTDPEALPRYAAQFPWATSHLVDRGAAGDPAHEARVVARYWENIWARLHGETDRPVLGHHPDGVVATIDAAKVESRLAVFFGRRLRARELAAERFVLRPVGGAPVEIAIRLFYGDDSHVVLVSPKQDLAAETDYELIVDSGLRFADGSTLERPAVMAVSTKTSKAIETPPSGCGATPGSPLALIAAAILRARRRRGRAPAARCPR